MNIKEMLENPTVGQWYDVALRIRLGKSDVIALALLKYLLEITPDDITLGDVDEIINNLHYWHTTYAVLHDNKINKNYPPTPPSA